MIIYIYDMYVYIYIFISRTINMLIILVGTLMGYNQEYGIYPLVNMYIDIQNPWFLVPT